MNAIWMHRIAGGWAATLAATVTFGMLFSLVRVDVAGAATDPQIEELKAQVRILMERVNQLEKEKAQPPAKAAQPCPAAPPPTSPVAVVSPPAAPEIIEGHASPIRERGAFNDQQEAAPRPDDLTLDPKYQGFTEVPNTPVLIKFNAKPRVDATYDNKNSGNDDRFVTAQIPVTGDPTKGGDGVYNMNAKGSQIRIDVRAPTVAGSPRFYYENDFFGSGGGEFPFRVRHLYGQIYNIIVGQTYSVFEDPDIWPDTVDFEGPSSAIFARRPLIRYQHRFTDEWQLNLGIEQPGAEIDTTGYADANGHNSAPDGGFNVRWERASLGHVQLAAIFRDLGVSGTTSGNQDEFGWGLNLAGGFSLFKADSMQTQLTYGQGIFRYINDDFQNEDAAFDRAGHLQSLPYFGAMFGYTHRWSDSWRSTVSYGFTTVDNSFSQAPDAYHQAHYGSINLMWQIRKRLSVGLEELYGHKKTADGSEGDVFRTQLGLVYSIFD